MDDTNAREAAQEAAEEHRRIHAPFKRYYEGRADLAARLGAFPLFWRDLAAWPGYREAYREYSRWLEARGA